MHPIHALVAYLAARWQDMTDPAEADRGDSPVGTAVITAILVAGAVVVAGAIVAVANGWVALIPTQP
ncbi:hypothetical protein GA0074696_4141 [Micromonospora purpureochromogenes]|uniref:Uncharacterized protein n=1 Tax=Micromonospora purpureochromogenes TaxID=47872 RepID=A0A1C4Z8X6_9ACTN|nr:hypothetical protein [Micromonospora purpureochromogenes]SCF29161.1 hypothetical protein GA0074696_4141 [Micromonospora purpureochromogenes]